MKEYRQFIQRLILNYIVGSFLAVFVAGGIPMFMSIKINHTESLLLIAIIAGSLSVMAVCEFLFFMKQKNPIKKAFDNSFKNPELTENAYSQLLKFPELTAKRIMGPHLFGFSVPAASFSLLLIHNGLLNFSYIYVVYASVASLIIASMHALIEYFLTIKAIQPVIMFLNQNVSLPVQTLKSQIRVPINLKLGTAIVLIGIFPVILFLLSAQVKIQQVSGMNPSVFWKWAGVVLIITMGYSILISRIMAKDIQKPILQLQQMMGEVEKQNYIHMENVYTDEFSDLFNGFNKMIHELEKHDAKNKMMLESFLMVLSAALDARDKYTSGHSVRVADFSKEIGIKMNLPKDSIEALYKTALLHDIGKIGVPDKVLLKDGRLSDEEFNLIKAHPVIGENILKQVHPISEIADFLPGVRSHHERMDGKGYPDGLTGKEIPLFGRIIAVADSFDAMTSDRPYRKGMPQEKAGHILHEGRGTQWDAKIVDLFIEFINESTNKEKVS